MGGAREEIEGFCGDGAVFLLQNGDVAGLGGRVAREINNGFWGDGEEFSEELGVATGAGRIEDDGLVGLDEV